MDSGIGSPGNCTDLGLVAPRTWKDLGSGSLKFQNIFCIWGPWDLDRFGIWVPRTWMDFGIGIPGT